MPIVAGGEGFFAPMGVTAALGSPEDTSAVANPCESDTDPRAAAADMAADMAADG